MISTMVIQGRALSPEDIGLIQRLLVEHPDWGRTRLSEELCSLWDWRNANGRIKDMAARTLLLKLERGGFIQLPARRRPSSNAFRNAHAPWVEHTTAPLCSALRELMPVAVRIVESGSKDLQLFNCLLDRYHYLGHRNTVGENMRYLIRDREGRPLGCALFGSAAWKCAARDAWVGWDRGTREANLGLLTNNTRFLVLPWVTVPHLASHLLAYLARRIRSDWQRKYGHPIHALETFVDRERFKGTCYQAANWLQLSSTQGRTRNDCAHCIRTVVKDVYFYPLTKDCHQKLCAC